MAIKKIVDINISGRINDAIRNIVPEQVIIICDLTAADDIDGQSRADTPEDSEEFAIGPSSPLESSVCLSTALALPPRRRAHTGFQF